MCGGGSGVGVSDERIYVFCGEGEKRRIAELFF